MDIMQWVAWLAGAVAVVGGIEYLKGFAPMWPAWVWRLLMPVASIGAAIAAGGPRPGFDALGITALAQLGYTLIVRKVRKGLGDDSEGGETKVSGFTP